MSTNTMQYSSYPTRNSNYISPDEEFKQSKSRGYHHHLNNTIEDKPTQVSKTKSIKRRRAVRFSEMSSLLCYNVEAASQQEDLHYASSDYARFKRDASREAYAIRCTIGESSNQADSDSAITDKTDKSKSKSPLMRYTDSWKRLPKTLQENGIDLDRVIGIEHLAIGEKMLHVSLALRNHSTRLVLEEHQLQCSRDMLGDCDPELLARAAEPFSKVSTFIAFSRAKHATEPRDD